MTEQEYIDVTNLTKIESALAILRKVHNADDKIEQAREILYIKTNELHNKFVISG